MYKATNPPHVIMCYTLIDESSAKVPAENSSFVVNVRTAESATRIPFSLNNTRLFRPNVHALFIMNNPVLFRLNGTRVALSAVLTFATKDEFSFEPAPTLIIVVYVMCR